MPVSITSLLADRLDISEERAQSLLQTLLQELRRRAETDGVRLPELGTFRVEDDTLTFEPSPSLRRRVNQEYEGLSTEETSPTTAAEPPPLGSPEQASDERTAEETPDEDPVPAAEGADEEEPAPQPAGSPEPQPAAEESAADSFTVISLLLAFLFVLGAGWLVLDRTDFFSPTPSDRPPVASEQSPSNQEAGVPTDTGTSPTADTGAVGPTDDEQANQTTAATTARAWTIVVASRTSRSAAEATANEYTSRFDSVEIVPGTIDDQTWYRVSVGRYASEAAAERVLNERAADLPSGAWIHRLR